MPAGETASWVELSVVVSRGLVDPASGLMMAMGATGVVEEPGPGEAPVYRQPWDRGPAPKASRQAILRGWWPEDCVPDELEAALRKLGVSEPVTRARVDEQDWGESWKEHFHRIEISPRLAVAPPWEARPGDVVIEPGLAFGTGEHVTTFAALQAVDRLAQPGQRCLDVGCGSGVLALAAARLGMSVWGVDIDPEATRAAREAAAANDLDARFDETPLAEVEGVYDLVVANLFAEVLVALAPDLNRVCAGRLVMAGILADRAQLVLDAFSSLTLVHRRDDGDWVALEYSR